MNKNISIILAVIVLAALGIWAFGGSDPSEEAIPATDSTAATGMPIMPEGDHMMPDGAVMEDGVMLEESAGQGGVMMPVPGENVAEKEAIREIAVTARSFSFSPATITVKKGETVRLTLKNTGGLHDLRIDEFKAATKQLQAGEEETIEFIADKTGTFEYYCSVGNHRAMGMVGKLIVE